MNATQREILRNSLLTALEASGAYAPTIPVLRVQLRTAGFPALELDTIKTELLYLKDKGFAQQEQKTISPENSGWRITAVGRDHLAMEGLA